MKRWEIYYRGSLSSCNYACTYCPFGKTANSRAELRHDRLQLERFCTWVETQRTCLGVLITPWGEALHHGYYRRAMVSMSRLKQVYRVAIQTNLHGPVADMAEGCLKTLALWTTYHPTQVNRARFLSRCRQLDRLGIRYSVGMVGIREHFEEIEAVRRELRPEVYLWVNAYKRQDNYYSPSEIVWLSHLDPHFSWNLKRYPSQGKACHAGHGSFAVDGDGNLRRCHFVPEILGNIYEPDWEHCLRERLCPAATCGCHIGYIHRPELPLRELYGDGLLERIPASTTW